MYRSFHADAERPGTRLAHPSTGEPAHRALLQSRHSADWQEIRQRRRAGRLDEIHKAVEAIGALPRETRETTALLR